MEPDVPAGRPRNGFPVAASEPSGAGRMERQPHERVSGRKRCGTAGGHRK